MAFDTRVDVRRHWAQDAQGRLARLTDAVSALREAVESGSPIELEPQADLELASEVVVASNALSEWLDIRRAPKGLGKVEGELAATAGVYRNAAVAYRSLSDVDRDRSAARFVAYVKLLHQGDDHVELFASLLRRKLQAA